MRINRNYVAAFIVTLIFIGIGVYFNKIPPITLLVFLASVGIGCILIFLKRLSKPKVIQSEISGQAPEPPPTPNVNALPKATQNEIGGHAPITEPQLTPNVNAILDHTKDLLQQGKLPESLAIFKHLIETGLAPAEGYYGIGYIKYHSGDFVGATAEFLRAIKASPSNANAYYFLGLISENEKDEAMAHTYYEHALAIDPKHGGAIQKLGAGKKDPSI